jgi:hypothetical protein
MCLESLKDHEVVASNQQDTNDTVVKTYSDDSTLVGVRVVHDVGARTSSDKLPRIELPVFDKVPHHNLAILADGN